MAVLFTIIAALAIGLLFLMIKIPAGLMLGALTGAFLFNIIFEFAYIPTFARTITQIISGTVIACSINKDDITNISKIIRPFTFLMLGMLFVNLTAGFLINRISNLDLLTSLMSAVPGGMSEMTILSAEMGGNAPKVALLQLIRMLTAIGFFPIMAVKMTGDKRKPLSIVAGEAQANENNKSVFQLLFETGLSRENVIKLLITLPIAFCLGMIGRFSGLPAGTLMFTIIGVMVLKFTTGRAYMPVIGRRIAQVIAGAYIGSSITRSELFEFTGLVLPAIILVSLYCLNCIVMGYVLFKKFGMERREAMLAAMPAGASDIALISSELGVHGATLIKIQVLRLLTVITIFPQVMAFIVFLAP